MIRPLMPLHHLRWSRLAAAGLLGAMFLVMLGSAREDALTMDEPIHLTAGYAYLRFQDARLNPEHPPLLKLLAALPLLPLPLTFPLSHPVWQSDAPWQIWHPFLYEFGNDPHQIAARARLVPMALTVGLGGLLFHWMRRPPMRIWRPSLVIASGTYGSAPVALQRHALRICRAALQSS